MKEKEREILFMKCLLSFFKKCDITQWVDDSLLMRDVLFQRSMNILPPWDLLLIAPVLLYLQYTVLYCIYNRTEAITKRSQGVPRDWFKLLKDYEVRTGPVRVSVLGNGLLGISWKKVAFTVCIWWFPVQHTNAPMYKTMSRKKWLSQFGVDIT